MAGSARSSGRSGKVSAQMLGNPRYRDAMARRPARSVEPRRQPLLPWVPPMRSGSSPGDGGALSGFSTEEADRIASSDPFAAQFLRPMVGAKEIRSGTETWCLWLPGANPESVRSSPELAVRIDRVRAFRAGSAQEKVRVAATRPQEFLEVRQPWDDYLAVPNRVPASWRYVPTIRLDREFIAKNSLNLVESLDPLVIGYVNSRAFALWCEAVDAGGGGGRKLPPTLTYNTFPFPELGESDDELKDAADFLVYARLYNLKGGLDELYDNPDKMPEPIKKAHKALDAVVMESFGLGSDASDDELLNVMFARYDELTNPHPSDPPASRRAA